jgi:hypothetical protein
MKSDAKKCAHPPCSCMATSGDYCSPYCESAKEHAEINCGCEHADCRGRTR